MSDPKSPFVRVFSDSEALAREAASEFSRAAQSTIERSGMFRALLAGGSTPRKLYALLGAATDHHPINWNRVHLFWGDERFVPRTDPDSNYRMVRSALLEHIEIPPENVHPVPEPSECEDDPEAAARAYQAEIASSFSISSTDSAPSFDLVLLGLGPDAHTASLFPGASSLRESKRWVVSESNAPKPPPVRITLTPTILNRASRLFFLVSGTDKAKALANVLEGPRDPTNHPAQLIATEEPSARGIIWLADREAAGLLEHTPIATPEQSYL